MYIALLIVSFKSYYMKLAGKSDLIFHLKVTLPFFGRSTPEKHKQYTFARFAIYGSADDVLTST